VKQEKAIEEKTSGNTSAPGARASETKNTEKNKGKATPETVVKSVPEKKRKPLRNQGQLRRDSQGFKGRMWFQKVKKRLKKNNRCLRGREQSKQIMRKLNHPLRT
ncbi:hypothetical protein A2U01_0069391, partial [Trifolium medium]|nr:hypothetical protein [Trifolium medium]